MCFGLFFFEFIYVRTRHPTFFNRAMKVSVLATGSSGNCYVLESDSGDRLIIELGIRWSEILKGLDYQLDNVVGALISHRHKDHALEVLKAQIAGVHTYANEDVFSSLKKSPIGVYTHHLTANKEARIGGFRVLPLEVTHDAPCHAFVITADGKRVLFATDCVTLPYRVEGLSIALIECNYDDDTLYSAIEGGTSDRSELFRLRGSHMELTQTAEAVKRQLQVDNGTLREVVCIHASNRHSSDEVMIEALERATGLPIHIAKAGQVYTV